MRDTFKPVTGRVAILSLALLLGLYAPAARAARGRGAGAETAATAVPAAAPAVPDQSGYWARVVARDATVRARPGGRVVGSLSNGQWFHVYPSYGGNSAWLLGYMCPRGNRGCGNRESIPGFILRSVLTGLRADSPTPATSAHQLAVLTASDEPSTAGDVRFISARFRPATPPRAAAVAQGVARRICSEQVWMRNDRLWPIELLYKNERFYVERYTDGSQNDGNRRWAIGRARGIRGRVLVTSLCP